MLSRIRKHPLYALTFALALMVLAADPSEEAGSPIVNLGGVLPLEIGEASAFELPLTSVPEEPPVTTPARLSPPRRQSRGDGLAH
jgi:hypothetical protein